MTDAGAAPATLRATSDRTRIFAFVANALLVLLPILAVRIAPSSDLPQQMHQLTLAGRASAGLEPELVVRPFAPNRLGYVPLALGRALGGAHQSGRVALALLALAWVAALHLYARGAGLDVAAPVFASLFLFDRLLYGGFLNFLCGLFGMLVWLRALDREGSVRRPLRTASLAFVASGLLFFAHALWFAGGTAIALTALLLLRFDARRFAATLAGLAPWAIALALWSRAFRAGGWQTGMRWAIAPLDRFATLDAAARTFLGGLRGSVESVVVVLAAAWLLGGAIAALRFRARDPRPRFRAPAIVAGLLCLVAAAVLPTQVDMTVFFDARWAPFAMVFLLLGVPPPPVRPALARALALVLVAALALATTAAWLRFDRVELAGFDAAIAALPRGATVIGVDLGDDVPSFRYRPVEHLVAWAGVERGAFPSMSFVELESSLVVLRDAGRRPPWLPPRDPLLIYPSDLAHYDFALVRGPAARVARLRASSPPTRVVVAGGAWTLLASAAAPSPAAPTPAAPTPETAPDAPSGY